MTLPDENVVTARLIEAVRYLTETSGEPEVWDEAEVMRWARFVYGQGYTDALSEEVPA